MTAVPSIIALAGLRGSGKSAVAGLLEEWLPVERIRFADPLKGMLRAIGLSDAEIEGDRKESPCDLLVGCTPRRAMQTLGTEWGRNAIHPDLWTSLWQRRARRALAANRIVVVEDCRFPNEEAVARSMGGVVWRVDRAGMTPDRHISEAGVYLIKPDLIIKNDGTLDDLKERLGSIVFGPIEDLAGPMGRTMGIAA